VPGSQPGTAISAAQMKVTPYQDQSNPGIPEMKREIRPSSEFISPNPDWAQTSREFQILTIEELEAIEPTETLVGPFLRRPGLSVAYGAPKSGKSFLLLDMGLRKATGLSWHDGSPITPGRVVWVAAEGDRSIRSRVRSWFLANQVPLATNFRIVKGPVNLYAEEGFDLRIALERMDFRPSLIIFDTLARCSTGADENRASDIQRVVEEIYHLSEQLEVAVVLIHHSGKGTTGPRGSSALLAAADQAFRVSLTDTTIKVKSVAERDSEPFDDLEFELRKVGESLVVGGPKDSLGGSTDPVTRQVLAFLNVQNTGRWVTASEIRTELDLSEATLARRLKALIEKGLLEEDTLGGRGNPKAFRIVEANGSSSQPVQNDRHQSFPPPPPLQGGVGGGGKEFLEEAS
jgi:hypothetical protein